MFRAFVDFPEITIRPSGTPEKGSIHCTRVIIPSSVVSIQLNSCSLCRVLHHVSLKAFSCVTFFWSNVRFVRGTRV